MVENAPIIQKLRQLGLTRTEAEVYIAALQEAADGPVSGYKVAQAMWYWRHGKGMALLLGAFVLLAGGAVLQRWQERWGLKPSPLMVVERSSPEDKQDAGDLMETDEDKTG